MSTFNGDPARLRRQFLEAARLQVAETLVVSARSRALAGSGSIALGRSLAFAPVPTGASRPAADITAPILGGRSCRDMLRHNA